MKLFLTMLLLTVAQFAQAAEPVGRIFFTPEQRAQMDVLRAQRAVASQVRNEPIPEFVKYNGIVRRSGGNATVWVNGEPLTEAELRDKQSIIGRVGRNGQILLQTPQAAASAQVRLKVGQSAELLSGRIDEPYAVQRGSIAPKAKAETVDKTTNIGDTRPSGAGETAEPEASQNASPQQ